MPSRIVILIDDHHCRRRYIDVEAQGVGRPATERQLAGAQQVLLSLIARLIVIESMSVRLKPIPLIADEQPSVRFRSRSHPALRHKSLDSRHTEQIRIVELAECRLCPGSAGL